MADADTNDVVEKSETAEAVSPAKKTRQPRKGKAVGNAAVAASSASAEKPMKGTRAKRGSRAASAGNVPKTGGRSTVNAQTAITAAEPTSRASELTDEFEDLIKLEEENKALRQQLSEKLRAENADLRKRLGQG